MKLSRSKPKWLQKSRKFAGKTKECGRDGENVNIGGGVLNEADWSMGYNLMANAYGSRGESHVG